MRGKLLLIVGFAAGYVLGSRAGRKRYEDIKRIAGNLWNDPRVQDQVQHAEEFAKDKAPEVAEFLADGAKKVVSTVSSRTPAKTSTRKPSTRKVAAPKSGAEASRAAATE